MVIRMMRITEKGKLPTRGSEYAAGYDLYANNDEPITIMPNEIKQIFTDIAMEIPTGYFGAVYARSGLATKQGLRPPNCVGVIDSDYRGNIGVGLINDTENHVHLFLDETLREQPSLSFHPNDNRFTVVIEREEFEKYLSLIGNSYEYIKLY